MANWLSFAAAQNTILIKSDIEVILSEGRTQRTIIGYIALPLARKCIWQLPAPLRQTVWSTHSYNRHLNKWEYWQKLNGGQLMLPCYYRGWGLTSCLEPTGYCFPEWGRSAFVALLISSGSLFITVFSRLSRVWWVHAGAVRALNASMFRSISWLASLRLHVSSCLSPAVMTETSAPAGFWRLLQPASHRFMFAPSELCCRGSCSHAPTPV